MNYKNMNILLKIWSYYSLMLGIMNSNRGSICPLSGVVNFVLNYNPISYIYMLLCNRCTFMPPQLQIMYLIVLSF